MPTYTYEAMDQTTGAEVKDTIDATSEAEAQALVRQKGFFVTKIALHQFNPSNCLRRWMLLLTRPYCVVERF